MHVHLTNRLPANHFNLDGLKVGDDFLGCPECGFRLNPGEAAKPDCPECRSQMLIYTMETYDLNEATEPPRCEMDTAELLALYRKAMATPGQPAWSRKLAINIMADHLAKCEKMAEEQIIELLTRPNSELPK